MADAQARRWARRVRRTAAVIAMLAAGCGHGGQRFGEGRGKMAKYDWDASNSAPAGCPMKLVVGGFLLTGEGSQYIPSAILHEGWGQMESAHVVGDKFKALPEGVNVTFYSYLEDKFYSGTFALPRDRIGELFAAGYRTRRAMPGEELTYNTLVAGVAPGGAVAVWMMGIGRTTEVFFGQAQEDRDVDWHDAMRMPPEIDRKEKRERAIAEAAKSDPLVLERRQHLGLGVWASYRPRYALTFSFEGEAAENMEMSFFNGEQEDIFFPQDQASLAERRAAPKAISLEFPQLSRYVEWALDEAETLEVFQRLGGNGQPIEMIFKRELQGTHFMYGVFLRNAQETVELNKPKLKVYRF